MTEPLTVVPMTVAAISKSPVEEGVKVANNTPPTVFALRVAPPVLEVVPPLLVVAPLLKVPPPEEVRITVASVRLPWESVTITVIVVVAPLAIGLLPAVTVTRAAGLALPDPVAVPLDTLSLLLTSELLHPNKINRAAAINPIVIKMGSDL